MFKVGDRVVAIKSYFIVRVGDTGTVVDIDKGAYTSMGVKWDRKDSGFHGCNGNCEYGYGYYVPEGNIKLQEFKVGDRVQFKTWEEMAKEFEVIGDSIQCEQHFTKAMEHLCGTFATIESIANKLILLTDFTAKGYTGWTYSTDMIKLAEPQKTPQKPQKPQSKLTDQELKILTSIDKKYLARDLDGLLFAYSEKPMKDIGGQQWYSSKPYKEIHERNLFMFITWDNSPVEIKILLKGGENERN